ncbi:catalase [Domibacillus antri]|uniref:Catalase-related peroxidase n=1 Tax=Domibacillus antri TaxID=1714264 RepID=A0A1Q8Q350_9BACI|nr:catalase family peroxidase [Domibacillus antri]OLN21770.1 catalase [Domibacillus antri]
MEQNKPELAKKAIDLIEHIAGTHPGYRRAHAKGIYCEAVFTPNGHASPYTTAAHLQKEKVKAIVRFSDSSPNPNMVDMFSPVKGMSVQFQLPDGKAANLVGVTVPVFITKTPEAFVEILSVMEKKPGPRDLLRMFIQYPESRAAFRIIKNTRPFISYSTSRYYPIHTFYFVNEAGEKQPVKYEWEPDDTWNCAAKREAAVHPADYLEAELTRRFLKGPIDFNLTVILGEESDPVDDSTAAWPKERQKITIGHLSIMRKLDYMEENIVFDPTVVPQGIMCTDDPVLRFRSEAYAVSFERRLKGQ